ncbi:hypothetical protein ES703_74190 [subsurface metagenome]
MRQARLYITRSSKKSHCHVNSLKKINKKENRRSSSSISIIILPGFYLSIPNSTAFGGRRQTMRSNYMLERK